ncbi:MAG TPA: glycosyltransferase, partial [Rugosimonospora sp.]|nr:glycosyltransferase [Rugosimonospora sp.]
MHWLAFGTYDTAAHPRVAALIDGVRAHGYEIVEVDEPLGLSTAQRVRMLHQPWRVPRLGYHLLRAWARLVRRTRALRRASRTPDVVLVGYLGHFDVLLARRLFPDSRIVLDHLVSAAGTAADRGATGRLLHRLLRALDRAALRRADVVVVDTQANRDRLPPADPGRQRRDVVVPVGATAGWFAAAREPGTREPDGPLRVVFFGLFTPLQGVPVIAAAAARLADDPRVAFTLIGRGQEYERCRALAAAARIEWLDWVPGAELPGLVAAHDVCLGIFGDTSKGRSVVPTKVFQGAAAGCAVVTSDTPSQ